MTQLTDGQINQLRVRPHNTKLWLSIYQPPTIFSAQVNDGAIAKGAREIIYNNDSGDYNDVRYGMTMYVGSSAGAMDKGKIRVKSADGSKINVAENSHIDWEDDDYLTVVNFFEINAIYPRIIQDPGDETKTIWYKDYDIAYSNQNSFLGTFICMGSHYAGFLSGTGTCDVYYTSTGTNYLVSGSSSYHWLFEGGAPASSSADVPGYVTYDTPGHYTTTFIVSGSAGGVDISYRHVSIYDHPEDGTNIPILSWELLDLAGDRDGGGYLANIRLRQNIDNPDLIDGALVVIFAEDWYDMEKVSIGGNSENRETIFFVGYIIEGSIRYNWIESYVEFQVGSPTEIMKEAEGFSISVEDSRNPLDDYNAHPEMYPSPWMLLLDMDVRRALYHYMRFHSTIMKCCDFQFLGTDQDIQYFDSDRSSLYDALQTLFSGALLGRVVSDRQGKIWSEIDIYAEQSPYITSNLAINKRDWIETPDITERLKEDVSFIEAGGIFYNPGTTTGSYTPLLCQAPGVAPSYRGNVERFQGLALSSQAHLNQIVGDLFAYKNAQYPDITLNVAGNYRNFDIAPQEKFLISIPAADTVRNVAINTNFFVKSLDWKYVSSNELLYPFVSFHEITDGFDADTLTIPITPPTQTGEGGTIDVPPITVPPIIPPIPPVIPPVAYNPVYVFIPALGGTPATNDANLVYGGNLQKNRGAGNPLEDSGVLLLCPDCQASFQQYAWAFGAYIIPSGITSISLKPILAWSGTWGGGDTISFYQNIEVFDLAGDWTSDHYQDATYTSKPKPTGTPHYAIEMTISDISVGTGYLLSLQFSYKNGLLTSTADIAVLGWVAQLA